MKVIGTTRTGLIIDNSKDSESNNCEERGLTISLLDLTNGDSLSKSGPKRKLKSLNVPIVKNENEKTQEIIHTSVQILSTKTETEKEEATVVSTSTNTFYLVTLVKKLQLLEPNTEENSPTASKFVYCATLLLLQEKVIISGESDISNGETTSIPTIIEEVKLTENQEKELRVHVLPTSSTDTDESDSINEDSSPISSFKSQLVVLSLDECIMVYHIETLPFSSSQAKIEILCSECAAKSFCYAQWVPQHQFLAFAHKRKLQQSSFDDEDVLVATSKLMLSVLQFHEKFPRETVLNLPLDLDPNKNTQHVLANLVPDPLVLSISTVQLKILAHSSGAVYLFNIQSESTHSNPGTLFYSINLLHHNKNLNVEVNLDNVGKDALPLRIDTALYYNDQYLVVAGWPLFIHLLDVGTSHEPSHHIIFDFKSLIPSPSQFSCLYSNEAMDQDKVHKPLSFVFQDGSVKKLELNSSILLPILQTADVKFKLAVMHFLLVHLNDVNVAKRILYDEGKNPGNLHLKHIYQEFLIGNAYLQTKKQLMPNLEPFLHLVPYCPSPESDFLYKEKGLSIKVKPNASEVTTMLLSPSQRVFPHNITDVWTSLWDANHRLTKSNRFSHANIAEKLLLSLQCYKPEALSRASTPMSPSSPMICASLGDIAGLFGRRTTELQLPFIEHESCTANKQEYVFSINLRELSMHLLKERKEWPLHGHTVAGKYVCALVDTARLLCHLACLTVHLQPTKTRDKGFRLIDSLNWETRLKLFMLLEHYSLALGTLACPLPQGYTPFFAYLGYRVLKFDQFLWHVRSGTFDLQIDLVKTIMADMKDSDEDNVAKKLHLVSLLPKSRANRVLNGWSHPMSVCLRARQHSSDLLSGVVSQQRKSLFATHKKKKGAESVSSKDRVSALDTFFQLLTAKANASDIDLGLLTEATMISMEEMTVL